MTYRRRAQNTYSYDTDNLNLTSGYGGNLTSGFAGNLTSSPYGASHDGFSAYSTYPGLPNATRVIDWPAQSDVYGTIGNRPQPLTVLVPKTVMESQEQTVHVPRTVMDVATKTISVPRTVMDRKTRMVQEPQTVYEQHNQEYKVPKTVMEVQTRIIQVPRTIYEEKTVSVNVPKTVYETHTRKITVPKTVIREREESYDVPRQIVESKQVDYNVARTVYDAKTTHIQVPRTVMETQTIEPKAVTYHVTKYVYPNMSGDINPQDTLEGSQHLFPDARRGLGGTYNQPQDAYNYRNTNSYGLYGGTLTRPGPNGSSAGPGPKPYSSAGPYTNLQAPFISTVGPTLSNTFTEPTVFGNGTIFPSFTQGVPQVNDIFNNRNSPSKSAYYQNGVLTIQRQ